MPVTTIPDFEPRERLHESAGVQIWRGLWQRKVPAIAKVLRSGAPSHADVAMLRHEFTMTSLVDSPHVPKSLAFLHTPNKCAALIVQDAGATGTLEQTDVSGWTLGKKLRSLADVARALVATHRAGITHHSINPGHILIVPGGPLQLVGFRSALRLDTDRPELSGRESPIATLPYISPEQTGRMGYGVDYRSDLYSFGVVLYQLLCGALPFNAEDVSGWVYAHIAAQPRPLLQQDASLPPALAQIADRLLHKDRESRYQMASGLLHDLENVADLVERDDASTPIELGTRDRSDRFAFPDRLYGRSQELGTLTELFGRVTRSNRCELALVMGAPGIGKSSLVRELQKPLTAHRGLMISGKFDLLKRAKPLTALTEALEDLAGQLLKLNEETLARYRAATLEAVGSTGQVLTDLTPSLGLFLGAQPPVAALGGMERLNRLKHTVNRFVRAVAEVASPLVLFVDDLQWVDPASLVVLEHLLADSSEAPLIVVGAYRDNEVDSAHPLEQSLQALLHTGLPIHRLFLGPLEVGQVEQLLGDCFRCDPSRTHKLARIAVEKTEGNPFFLRQFLSVRNLEGDIYFDHQAAEWQWDAVGMSARGTTDNVSQLLFERFTKLPEKARRLIQLAGCIGNRFDLHTLATVAEASHVQTFVGLWPSLKGGLLIADSNVLERLRDPDASQEDPISDTEAGHMIFRFGHDRIQQAAVSSLEHQGGREAVHLEIGRTLLQNLGREPEAQTLFQAADQLNAGRALLTETTERQHVAELDLSCGKLTIDATAYASAINYLQVASELLGDARENAEQRSLWFDVHLELARTYYLTVQFDAASAQYPALLECARSDDERLRVYAVQVEHSMLAVTYEEGYKACVSALQIHGLTIPAEHELEQAVADEFTATERLIGGRAIASLIEAPEMRDQLQLRRLKELDRLSLLTYLASSAQLNAWAIAKMTSISLEYGHVSISGFAYSFFGYLLSMRGEHQRSQAFGQLGTALADKYRDPSVYGRAYLMYYAFSSYYAAPLAELSGPMYRAYPVSLEGGDLAYAGYLLVIADYFRFARGLPLSQVRADTERHLPFLTRSAPLSFHLFTLPYTVYGVTALMEEDTTSMGFEYSPEEYFKSVENIPIGQAWYYAGKLKVEAYAGERSSVAEIRKRVETIEQGIAGQYLIAESKFYASLQLLAILREADEGPGAPTEEERALAERLLDLWQRRSQADSEQCRANFGHMFHLVEAERSRNRGELSESFALYEKALVITQEYEYLDKEALANELYAACLQQVGARSGARDRLVAALRAYEEWGCRLAVRRLLDGHRELAAAPEGHRARALLDESHDPGRSAEPRERDHERASAHGLSQRLDLETVLKAARAVSRQTRIEKLLPELARILRENIGASRCLVLTRQDGPWRVAASSSEGSVVDEDFSDALVRFVGRKGTHLVLNDPAQDSSWASDEHFARERPRSVLAAPVGLDARTLGVIYADNHLTPHAFPEEHVAWLAPILSQAAISMENARLFGELQTEKEHWHSLVGNAADLIVIVDGDCRVEFANRISADLAAAPAIGSPLDASFSEEVAEKLRSSVASVLESGESSTLELEVKSPIGTRQLVVRVGPLATGQRKQRASIIFTDVSERNLLTEQLRQAQKMEAVGTLAGGVAHDFNNLLTVILGACDLGELAGTEEKYLEALQCIREAGLTAATLTRKLLAFSRKQVLQPRVVELDALLSTSVGLLRRIIGEHIDLQILPNAGGRKLRIDPGGLEQAVMNLAVNARDAMPAGGTLEIRSDFDDELGELFVSVSDTGTGMSLETKTRIFEPFFTTKELGEGTGLGLSMVYGLVEQSGGSVSVESHPGVGTTFTLSFPAHVTEDKQEGDRESQSIVGGSESILLVEDDERLREVVTQMLTGLGYSVSVARNAEEALKERARMPRCDLLFTDVVMPGMSGPSLARSLRHLYGDIKVLFTTGYTNDAVLRHGVHEGTVHMLQKPFSREVLATRVRQALGSLARISHPPPVRPSVMSEHRSRQRTAAPIVQRRAAASRPSVQPRQKKRLQTTKKIQRD